MFQFISTFSQISISLSVLNEINKKKENNIKPDIRWTNATANDYSLKYVSEDGHAGGIHTYWLL